MNTTENNDEVFRKLLYLIPIEYDETPIEKFTIPRKYERLIRKIKLINSSSAGSNLIKETYIGIMNLDSKYFGVLKSVGHEYVMLLESLQNILPHCLEAYFVETLDKGSRKIIGGQLDISIGKIPLPFYYESLIRKIYRTTTPRVISRTVGGILNIDPDEFQFIRGVGKRNVDLLRQLQEELPIYIELYKKGTRSHSTVTTNNNSSDNNKKEDHDISIPLSELRLPLHYKALLQKINSALPIPQTANGILSIHPDQLQEVKGVGRKYQTLLVDLQKELPDLIKLHKEYVNIKESVQKKQLSHHNINYLYLDASELKLLTKLNIHYGADSQVSSVLFILDLNTHQIEEEKAFGVISLSALYSLQSKIINELESIANSNFNIDVRKKGLLISDEIQFLDMSEIDNILVEDTEEYLWSLNDIKMDVAISCWGFNHQVNSLEKVAKRHKKTRELMRQHSEQVNSDLRHYLRIHPKVLLANIHEHSISDLERLLPNLAKCFSSQRLFYTFIEICCQLPKGNIINVVFPDFKTNLLDQFFSSTPSPVSHEDIIGELMSNFGYSSESAKCIISSLVKSKRLEISDKGITPKNMTKENAIAHVLTNHPAGLPWKDVTRIVNLRGFSATKTEKKRVSIAFGTSDMIYLCGLGTYRHIMFINVEQSEINDIFQNIIKFLKSNRLKSIHLHDYFYQNKGNCQCDDYFILRHLIRNYGEGYGLFFSGTSGVDSISVNRKAGQITGEKVVLKALSQASECMTIQEVAERIRSKSIRHANFYIYNLINKGKAIRIDKMMYTTPENAFKNVNKGEILQIAKEIMNSSGLVVDSDVFREHINLELNLSYSKYFYGALIKTEIKKQKWYSKHTLFSTEPIQYNSLYDITKQHCDLSLSNQDNIKILQKHVMTTEASAIGVINNVRYEKDNRKESSPLMA